MPASKASTSTDTLCLLQRDAVPTSDQALLQLLLESSFRPAGRGAEAVAQATAAARVFLARLLCRNTGPRSAYQIGKVYERLQSYEARHGPHGEVEVYRSQASRKAGGVFYTPRPVVDATVRATLSPLTRKAVLAARALPASAPLGDHLAPFLAFRVLDPAVGCGSFLLSAACHLARAMQSVPAIACQWRLSDCRAQVATRCLYGLDTDPEAVALATTALSFLCGCPLDLGGHLRCGDALREPWDSAQAFDAIVGNPPWVSFSGRQAQPLPPDDRRWYAARFRGFRGWLSVHGLFVELALRLARPGGRVGLVAPAQIADLAGYQALRDVVRGCARLAGPPRMLGEKTFAGVTAPAAIFVFERVSQPQPPARAYPGTWTFAPESDPVIRKMLAFPPLPRQTFSDPGVHTGNSASLVISSQPDQRGEWAPVREGRDVFAYRLGPPRLLVWTQPDLPPGRYCRIGPLEHYCAARILIRQTASRPVAARHVEPCHFRNSVLACSGVPWMTDEVLLAILNSSLVAYFHQRSFRDGRQRAFPQVKVSHLRAIPLPSKVSPEAAKELTRLVRRAEAAEPGSAEFTNAAAGIDLLVCSLYGLSSAETRRALTASSASP